MPTYEYICSKCDHHFELFQPISEPRLEICPKEHCLQKRWGKGKVKRAIGGGAGLIFKGSGFYITDYRSEGYKEAAKKEAAASSPPKEGGSGGAEGKKPAPAGEGKKPSAGASGSGGGGSESKPAPPAAKPPPKKES